MIDLQISGVAQFEYRFYLWRIVQLFLGSVFVIIYVCGAGNPFAQLIAGLIVTIFQMVLSKTFAPFFEPSEDIGELLTNANCAAVQFIGILLNSAAFPKDVSNYLLFGVSGLTVIVWLMKTVQPENQRAKLAWLKRKTDRAKFFSRLSQDNIRAFVDDGQLEAQLRLCSHDETRRLPLKTAELIIVNALPILEKVGMTFGDDFSLEAMLFAPDETPDAMLKPCAEAEELDLSNRQLKVTLSSKLIKLFMAMRDAGTNVTLVGNEVAFDANATSHLVELNLSRICDAHTCADLLATSSVLRSLDLSMSEVDGDGGAQIANVLRTNSTLRTLLLQDNHMDDVAGKAFVDALTENKTLACINLLGNRFSTGVAADLGKVHCASASLFSVCGVSERHASEFCFNNKLLKEVDAHLIQAELRERAARGDPVAWLDVSANPDFGAGEGEAVLLEILREQSSLTGVNLLATGLSEKAADEVCEMLGPGSRLLTAVGFKKTSSHIDMCSPDGALLRRGSDVRFNRHATTVTDIYSAQDGSLRCDLLLDDDSKRDDVPLSRIQVSHTLQPAGAILMAASLDNATSTSLTSLNVLGHAFGPRGAEVLAEAFAKHEGLRTLIGLKEGQTHADLSGRGLSAVDAILIAADLDKPHAFSASLLSLNLLRNSFGEWDQVGKSYDDATPHVLQEQSLALLSAAFQRHKSLKSIAGFTEGQQIADFSHRFAGGYLYGRDESRVHDVLNDWMDVALIIADTKKAGSYGSALTEIDLRGNDFGGQWGEHLANPPHFHYGEMTCKILLQFIGRVDAINFTNFGANVKRGLHNNMFTRVGIMIREREEKPTWWLIRARLSGLVQMVIVMWAWYGFAIIGASLPGADGCYYNGLGTICVDKNKQEATVSIKGVLIGSLIIVSCYYVILPILLLAHMHVPSAVRIRSVPQHIDCE